MGLLVSVGTNRLLGGRRKGLDEMGVTITKKKDDLPNTKHHNNPQLTKLHFFML